TQDDSLMADGDRENSSLRAHHLAGAGDAKVLRRADSYFKRVCCDVWFYPPALHPVGPGSNQTAVGRKKENRTRGTDSQPRDFLSGGSVPEPHAVVGGRGYQAPVWTEVHDRGRGGKRQEAVSW